MKRDTFIQFGIPVTKKILGITYNSIQEQRIATSDLAHKMKEYLSKNNSYHLIIYPNSTPFVDNLREASLQYIFNTFSDEESNIQLFNRLQSIISDPAKEVGYLQSSDWGQKRNAFGQLPGRCFSSFDKVADSICTMKKADVVDLIVPRLISDLQVLDSKSDLAVVMGPDAVGFYAYYAV